MQNIAKMGIFSLFSEGSLGASFTKVGLNQTNFNLSD